MNSRFKRVHGPRKTIESICMRCLLTAGISTCDLELAQHEAAHHCKYRWTQDDRPAAEVASRETAMKLGRHKYARVTRSCQPN